MNIQPTQGRDTVAFFAQARPFESSDFDSSDSQLRGPLEQLLQAVVTLAGADAAAVRHQEKDARQLRLVAAVGMPDSLWTSRFRVDDCCGACGESVAVDELRHSDSPCACATEVGKVSPIEVGHRTFVVPLHHRGAVCGVLKLFLAAGRKPPQSLAPLLVALGEMLGLTLENSRLMQQNLQASLNLERHMLANEVHDSLAQNLASMRMRTSLLRDAIGQHDDVRAARYVDELDESLIVSHRRVRALITHFRTEMDPRGLLHALGEAVAGFREMGEIDLAFDNRVARLLLAPEQELQVFHVISEALANVMKHAKARHCCLTIDEHDGHYVVLVEDDGIGLASDIDSAAMHGHFGLNIMRERVEQLGGHIKFENKASGGTRVQLSFPATAPGEGHDHQRTA